MEIIFKGRQTEVAARFREQVTAKLSKLEKLDQKAIRVDVEVSVERNPRQSSQKERVELTIVSRGPAIRAEAAAEDRFAAFDLALAKLDSRLRRALDRRKQHHAGHGIDRAADRAGPEQLMLPEDTQLLAEAADAASAPRQRSAADGAPLRSQESVVPLDTDGDSPLVVRQKFHHATAIPIDQALLEMELVGHDFYLFCDVESGMPSVVYRRRGYQYGVIRLIDGEAEPAETAAATLSAGQAPEPAEISPAQLARRSRSTAVSRPS
jgi:ribosomal subunit interface protein